MNKQNDMISKSKLLEWLEETKQEPVSEDIKFALECVKDAMGKGMFNPDPIPLPTLKPGDSVYHKRFKSSGTVKRISKSGKRAYVIWNDGYMPSYCDLNSLELIAKEDKSDVR